MSATPETHEGTVPESGDARAFSAGGLRWVARICGVGLGGTGRLGTAPFTAIRFFQEGESAPRFEALLPRGRLQDLYESELEALLAAARPLPPP